jgi:pimeloyl-ACP methyl ester carboxylesterase
MRCVKHRSFADYSTAQLEDIRRDAALHLSHLMASIGNRLPIFTRVAPVLPHMSNAASISYYHTIFFGRCLCPNARAKKMGSKEMASNALSRRSLMAGATAAGVLTGTAKASAQTRSAQTFVLVHGSWHGGWCWRRTSDLLISRGHRVFTPTLTGLADRSHLLSAQLTLDTHVEDIVNLVKWEDLKDFVLVAHSSSGFVGSAVAERLTDTIKSIVFLDAFLPEDGQRLADLAAKNLQEELFAAQKRGEVGRPPPPASLFVRNKADIDWVQSKLTPQPLYPSLTPVRLTGARDRIKRKTYIRASAFSIPWFDKALAKCRADSSWQTHVIDSAHDVMIEAPDKLTEILETVA